MSQNQIFRSGVDGDYGYVTIVVTDGAEYPLSIRQHWDGGFNEEMITKADAIKAAKAIIAAFEVQL